MRKNGVITIKLPLLDADAWILRILSSNRERLVLTEGHNTVAIWTVVPAVQLLGRSDGSENKFSLGRREA